VKVTEQIQFKLAVLVYKCLHGTRQLSHTFLTSYSFNLQVKRPNHQYQSTEGTNSTQTDPTYNNQT